MKIAAFDIGGTSLKMGVIDEQGNILTSESADISHNSRDKILDEILAWLEKNPGCAGIAVSTPGYIDAEAGYIDMGGTIRDFDQFHLSQWLTEKPHCLPRSKMTPIAPYWLNSGWAKQKSSVIF